MTDRVEISPPVSNEQSRDRRVQLTRVIKESNAGCIAECVDLRIGVRCPTLEDAKRGLNVLLDDYCRTLLIRSDLGDQNIDPKIIELAEKIIMDQGFTWNS